MNLKKYIGASIVLVLLVAAVSVTAQDVANQTTHQGPPMLGIHWAKGIHSARSGGSPDMTFHGGTVLTTTSSQTIFWGTSWATAAGDKITFRAECDLIFVVSACPNDVFKRPPLQPTDLEVRIETSRTE